jgi:hypothetical protein
MAHFFIDTIWTGPLLWAILYISDYTLTLVGARMYKAQNIIKIEGSFELNPIFQKDIDTFRHISPRFITFLCITVILLFAIWLLTNKSNFGSEWYLFILGAMIMLQLAIHIRHIHNWFFYRNCTGQSGIRGHIEYSRELILRISSLELLCFSLLFLAIFLFTYNWLLLGGAVSCTGAAIKHYRLAGVQKNLTNPAL